MRTGLIILFWGISIAVLGQSVNFEEDFSEQDISGWSGNTGNFTFANENGNILLQQDADGAGTSYLSIESSEVTGYWEFFVRMEFAPSAGNKAEIYLMSDRADLNGDVNGYKLAGGENGSNDVFRLFRIDEGTEAEEIIAGTTNISSGGNYRVKVIRDNLGNWTLEVGNGYAGVLAVEDTGTDNTYSVASYFGFKTTYTSTRSDLFAFDFKIDIAPLQVASLSLVSNAELDVTFSREIDFSSAQTSDFTLSPGNISPQSVTQQQPDAARITFPNPLPGGEYLLEISDIDDTANETTLADTTLPLIIFDDLQQGDVVINEFMKDPPEGTAEYIELRNTSTRYLNLKNWQIGDNNAFTSISGSDLALLPKSFAVISADTTALRAFFGPAHYIGASLPALNNTTDQIRVYDENGDAVDSLEYSPDWGGVDVAVERRDASVPGTFRENWGNSPAVNFGTPGFPNQIQPDETAPEIEDLVIQNNQTLLLVVSERLENTSAENTANYVLSQNPESGANLPPLPAIISAAQIAADTVQLTLDDELEEYPGSWTLAANNLTDIFGNTTSSEIEFNYHVIHAAGAGQVAINEFMYDPTPDFSEFVELYNHSESTFDLQEWTLNDNTGSLRSITDTGYILSKGEYVVLVPDSSIVEIFPGIPFINMASRFPALNNNTDAIVIRNENGTLIDSLTYTSAWGGNEVSLERRSTNFPAVFRENWGDSPSPNFATPALQNEVQEDTSPPELMHISRTSGNQVRLIFSERLQQDQAENTGNYSLTAENITNLPNLVSVTFTPPDTVLLQYDANLPSRPEGTTYELSVSGQTDIFGNTSATINESFFVVEYGSPGFGEVVITEFMYDPAEGYSEFIEIYNPTESAFNLQGWTYNDNSGNRQVISDEEFTLPPARHLLLTPDSTLLEHFPGISFIAMASRFSALNNSTDAIVIRDQNGVLLDSLT